MTRTGVLRNLGRVLAALIAAHAVVESDEPAPPLTPAVSAFSGRTIRVPVGLTASNRPAMASGRMWLSPGTVAMPVGPVQPIPIESATNGNPSLVIRLPPVSKPLRGFLEWNAGGIEGRVPLMIYPTSLLSDWTSGESRKSGGKPAAARSRSGTAWPTGQASPT